MTKISDRLRIIIEKEGITPSKFSKKLGYDRSQTIHDILNAKSNPSYDFFYKFIKSEYSEIYDLNWLITGDGEMQKQKMLLKNNQDGTCIANNSDNVSRLITILQNTLVEKDKQIESLLSIIKQGKV